MLVPVIVVEVPKCPRGKGPSPTHQDPLVFRGVEGGLLGSFAANIKRSPEKPPGRCLQVCPMTE
jgi:hypothetical protein